MKQIVQEIMIQTVYNKTGKVIDVETLKGKYRYKEPQKDEINTSNYTDDNFHDVLEAMCVDKYTTTFRHKNHYKLGIWCSWFAEDEVGKVEILSRDKILDKNKITVKWCQENLSLNDYKELVNDEGIKAI